MLLVILVSSLLGDVAPRRPAPPPAQCTMDSQCQLSTFNGCCGGCCQGAPHAVPVGVNEAERCRNIDCAMPNCAAVRCAAPPPLSEFVAACQAGRCVAVRKDPNAGGQCRIDRDCRVVQTTPPPGAACHQSACGCCPMTMAVPADGVVALDAPPGPPRNTPAPPQQDGKPKFGLSPGDTRAPPAPQCSPCPMPAEGTAACQQGRCVLVPAVPRPEPRPVPIPRPPQPHPVG